MSGETYIKSSPSTGLPVGTDDAIVASNFNSLLSRMGHLIPHVANNATQPPQLCTVEHMAIPAESPCCRAADTVLGVAYFLAYLHTDSVHLDKLARTFADKATSLTVSLIGSKS
jgi:hypothetical protein